MIDSSKTAMAAGVAAGYVLGRTRKGKIALAVVSLVVGRKLPKNPKELLSMGMRKLADSPQFAQLGKQMQSELMDSARAAVDRSLGSLADSLQERTLALKEGKREAGGERPAEGESEEEAPEPERPPRRAKKAAHGGEARAQKAPARKAAAKKAPARKSAAKRTPSSEKRAAKRAASSERRGTRQSSARTGGRR